MPGVEDGINSKNWVWAPSGDFFEKGYVTDYNPDGTCTVTIPSPTNEICKTVKQDQLENCNPTKFNKCHDMAELTHLNEPSVVFNLHLRYAEDLIYTYSGLFLVAINPYKPLNIYDSKTLNRYHTNHEKPPPHIFATAEGTLRNLLANSKDQSILVTGESGAGKTENTKKIIQYLSSIPHAPKNTSALTLELLTSAYHSNSSAPRMSNIETRILQANPILESFGNAKTIKNNNSSRFGKFIRIFFSSTGHINGANIDYYLLEKSRVVQQSDQERNYHVFYQFLKGHDRLHMLGLNKDGASYKYLNNAQIDIPLVDDFKDFNLLLDALRIMGFSEHEISSIFELIAVILHLGNLDFSSWKSEQASFTPESPVDPISSLLGIDPLEFTTNLLKPKVKAGRELVEKSRKPAEAKYAIDALAKHMYEKLFEFIISKINQNLQLNSSFELEKLNFIGVLDIAGFEIFDVNSFEQLCINYTNEKLQQFFNHHSFILEQSEYLREDIQWEFIDFGQDLQPTIDLIETTNPMGIFKILDEECLMPKSSDKSFMERLSKEWGRGQSTKFKENKFKSGFFINHYAGKVEYNIDLWLQKNTDPVSEHVLKLLAVSSNDFMKDLFSSDEHLANPSAGRGLKLKTASRKHKDQLSNLMEQLERTEPHFVRCILPNLEKKPNKLDKALVLHQLRCNGVLEGIRITRAGYPNRMTFDEFVDRYSILIDKDAFITSMRANSEMIIKSAKLDKDTFKIGITKIFFKNGVLGKLEELRDLRLKGIFTDFQSLARGHCARKRLKRDIQRIQAAKLIARTFNQVHELLQNNPWLVVYTKIKPMLEDSIKVLNTKELNDKLKQTALDLESSRKEHGHLLIEKEELQAQLADANVLLSNNKDLVAQQEKTLAERNVERESLATTFAESQTIIETLKVLLQEAIEKQDASEEKHRDLSDQLSAKLQEIETSRAVHSELTTKIALLDDTNKILTETNTQHESKIADLELNLNKAAQTSQQEISQLVLENATMKGELEQMKVIDAKAKALEDEMDKVKQENSDLNGELKLAREFENKHAALQKEILVIKQENEFHETRFALLNERNTQLESMVESLQGKDAELSRLSQQNEAFRAKEQSMAAENDRLEAKMRDLQDKLVSHEKVGEENDHLIRTVETLKEEMSNQVQLSAATIKDLEAARSTALARENQITDLETQLLSNQQQLKQLESRSKLNDDRVSKADQESKELSAQKFKQERTISSLQARLTETEQQLESLEVQSKACEKRASSATTENETLTSRIAELNIALERLSHAEDDLKKAHESIITKDTHISAIEMSLQSLTKEKTELEAALLSSRGEHSALLATSESFTEEISALRRQVKDLEAEAHKLSLNQVDQRFVAEFAEMKLKFNEATAELRRQKFENKQTSEELAILKERSSSATIKRESSFQRSLNGKIVVDLTGSEEVLKGENDSLRAQLHREEANAARAEKYAILLQQKLNKLQATRGLPSWTNYEKKYKEAEARIQQLEQEYDVECLLPVPSVVSRSESFSRNQLVNKQLSGASQEFVAIYQDTTATLKATREELSTTKKEVLRLKRLLDKSENELYDATRLGLQMSVARYDEEMAELKVKVDMMTTRSSELEAELIVYREKSEAYLTRLETAESQLTISQDNEEAAQRDLMETRAQMTLAREEARAGQIVIKELRSAQSLLEDQIEDNKFLQHKLENQIKAANENLDYAQTTSSNGEANTKYREEIAMLHKDLNFRMESEVALIKETKRLLLDLEEAQTTLKALEQDHLDLITKQQRVSSDLATTLEKSRHLEKDNVAYESKVSAQAKQINSLKDVMQEVVTQRDELLEQKENLEEEVAKMSNEREQLQSEMTLFKNDMHVMRDHLENYQKEVMSLKSELSSSKTDSLSALQDQTKLRKELLVACEVNETLKRVNKQLTEKTQHLEEELYSDEQLKIWKSKIANLTHALDEADMQGHHAAKTIKKLEKKVRELEDRHAIETRRAHKLNDENFNYQNSVNKYEGTIKSLHADSLESKVQLKSYERENYNLKNNLKMLEREMLDLQRSLGRSR